MNLIRIPCSQTGWRVFMRRGGPECGRPLRRIQSPVGLGIRFCGRARGGNGRESNMIRIADIKLMPGKPESALKGKAAGFLACRRKTFSPGG